MVKISKRLRNFVGKLKFAKYKTKSSKPCEITALIVLGNRQIIKRKVKASKKFEYEGETYVIKPKAIFNKVMDGKLKAISFYRQGNPNPYDFTKTNVGLSSNELKKLYGEDIYNMLVKVNTTNKLLYMFLITLFILILNVMLVVKILILGV